MRSAVPRVPAGATPRGGLLMAYARVPQAVQNDSFLQKRPAERIVLTAERPPQGRPSTPRRARKSSKRRCGSRRRPETQIYVSRFLQSTHVQRINRSLQIGGGWLGRGFFAACIAGVLGQDVVGAVLPRAWAFTGKGGRSIALRSVGSGALSPSQSVPGPMGCSAEMRLLLGGVRQRLALTPAKKKIGRNQNQESEL